MTSCALQYNSATYEVAMHSTHPDRGRVISLAGDAGALEALLADAARKVRARVELEVESLVRWHKEIGKFRTETG
jgi:hypothetical protein